MSVEKMFKGNFGFDYCKDRATWVTLSLRFQEEFGQFDFSWCLAFIVF
jgi:hypothetical protein